MNFKVFLIISTIFSFAASQTISCNYVFEMRYRCDATIVNPQGLDGDVQISGTHLDGRTNNDVREVIIVSGTTPIIPSALCQRFRFVDFFVAASNNGITRLTDGAFRDCSQLKDVHIRFNSINEIHPQTFQNNGLVSRVLFLDFTITALPEALFAPLPLLLTLEIAYFPSLVDLPANIFQNNRQLTVLKIAHNRLNIWRPEWTRDLTQLTLFSFWRNQNITSIPRNAVNAHGLQTLYIDWNSYEEIDFFMFNNIRLVTSLHLGDTPIRAIDFNLIDLAVSINRLLVVNCACINRDFDNFQQNRAAFMAELEPCFNAFDMRTLSEFLNILTYTEHLNFLLF
jgi:BspA type Leucine rich repeat region (6 copies)